MIKRDFVHISTIYFAISMINQKKGSRTWQLLRKSMIPLFHHGGDLFQFVAGDILPTQ